MNRRLFAQLLALAAFAAPARAQNASNPMAGNCMMQQLIAACPDAKPGTPDFSVCAKAHSADAMAACQAAGSAAQTRPAAAASSPCAADSQKFCPGKWPGTPEYSACMRSHINDVTPACAAWGKKRSGMKPKPGSDVCVADAKKVCPGLTVMDGAKFTTCMTDHYDGLSPACQAKFKGLKSAAGGKPAAE